jgi:hypothetical protein
MRNHRVTKAYFRTCSTCRSRSQAPLCLYTLRLVSNQPEGTIARLRYSLGGDRPSQTTHQAMSRSRIHGLRLDLQCNKGGISTTAPRNLTIPLQSVPPILHMMNQRPRPSYSKASRGLFVLLQLAGICTGIATSPSPPPRQRSYRYAIRAGRNLPDKEFRYLRTVIVTAAVHRGFSRELQAEALTPFLNLPAPGTRQSLYVVLRLSRDLCFW